MLNRGVYLWFFKAGVVVIYGSLRLGCYYDYSYEATNFVTSMEVLYFYEATHLSLRTIIIVATSMEVLYF